ncbi:porin [Geomonas agri]|uniref:porin n=1 Tax=Geomonas agri TaxID=2873702 RepID=UPI001CD4F1BF|nr:porin [Geomonas agri]
MKKSNKKLLVVAIATALTAASAGSALALENQFSGAFTTFFDVSNYNNTGVIANSPKTANYFVERVRLGYTAKADDHVKLVTKFEFDYNNWGNSSYNTSSADGSLATRGGGGALGADTTNIETKHLYLDLNYPALNTKIGMMPYNDAFKGIVFDADMAGVLLSHDYSNASIAAGFFRFADSNNTFTETLGRKTHDMFSLDGSYKVSKDLTLGAGYYFIKDNSETNGTPDLTVHTLGVNAAGNVGPVALSGFAVKQFGDLAANVDAKGYAFNLGAKMPAGGGTARANFLYVSGGKDAFYVATGNGGTEGGQFYDSEMTILGRDKWATTIDNAIIYDVNNNGEGVIMGTLGYDYNFTDKLSGAANVGFASIAKDGVVRPARNSGESNYLGTEINAEAYYKLSANVTLGARAGYVILGDYFANGSDNPYDLKLIANYSF